MNLGFLNIFNTTKNNEVGTQDASPNEVNASSNISTEDTKIDFEVVRKDNINLITKTFEKILNEYSDIIGLFDSPISSDFISLKDDKSIKIEIKKDTVIFIVYGIVYRHTSEYLYILGEKSDSLYCESKQYYIDEDDERLSYLCENFEVLVENILSKIKVMKDECNSLKLLKNDYEDDESKHSNLIQSFNKTSVNLDINKNRYYKIKKQNIRLIEGALNRFLSEIKGAYIGSENIYLDMTNKDKYVTIEFNPYGENNTCAIVFNDSDSYCFYKAYYVIGEKSEINKSKWACLDFLLEDIDNENFNFLIDNFSLFTQSLLVKIKKIDPDFDDVEFIKNILY